MQTKIIKKVLLLLAVLPFVSCTDSIQETQIRHVNERPKPGVFKLVRTDIDVACADFGPVVIRDELGYPRIDFKKFDTRNQGRVIKTTEAVVLENKYMRLTLFPGMGKPYSFIYKITGHEEFFIPEVAHLHKSPNELGWWFMLGGVEYTLPDEEHGDTWAADWEWHILEDSPEKKTVRMRVLELRHGLEETVDISVFPDKATYEAVIRIENPTESAVDFQHWINPMWTPGGRGEITLHTEFVIPTREVFATERKINDWMLDYHPQKSRLQTYAGNPMRFLAGWKRSGDLLAWNLEYGFYSAFCHEENEGIVRIFPKELNPGCNIWTWGFDPKPETRKLFSGNESCRGYVEMWGGLTHGFDKYYRLGPGEEISWTEWMYPYHQTAGLHFANEDVAVTFTHHPDDKYILSLCPSGDLRDLECRVVSPGTEKIHLRVFYESIYPKDKLPVFTIKASEEDLELIVLQDFQEIIRIPAQAPPEFPRIIGKEER